MSVRIMTDNFLDPDIVSHSYVSSEQTAFPVSNIYATQRRSKVWRSNGYWDITASNNTLIFRETTGVDLTATLTIDEYVSTSLLLAEIKTQMEAVGGSTYTISVDTTTNKIKFVSNGIGGGGIFQIIWTSCQDIASTLGFNIAEDDTGLLTYTADLLRISTGEWIKWDMGISTNPMSFILIGLRNKSIQITPSATITLQGNETDVWDDPTYTQLLTYNDVSISIQNQTGLHTEELRYWRLKIDDIDNSLGYVEIGALFLGDFFQATRGAVQYPFHVEHVDRSPIVFSEGGQTYSDIREKTEQFTLQWFGLTVSEKESLENHFIAYGTSLPFFISIDPDSVFSTTANYYIRYVKFESPPSFDLISPGNYTCSMTLREEL